MRSIDLALSLQTFCTKSRVLLMSRDLGNGTLFEVCLHVYFLLPTRTHQDESLTWKLNERKMIYSNIVIRVIEIMLLRVFCNALAKIEDNQLVIFDMKNISRACVVRR